MGVLPPVRPEFLSTFPPAATRCRKGRHLNVFPRLGPGTHSTQAVGPIKSNLQSTMGNQFTVGLAKESRGREKFVFNGGMRPVIISTNS